jgi:predicted permease
MEAAVVVLSESLWRAQFKGDDNIVGRIVHLNRVPFTVIGVAPDFPVAGSDNGRGVWIPYTMLGSLRASDEYFADRRANWLTIIGRRKLEYSQEQVQQELNILARNADAEVAGRKTSITVTDGSAIQDPGIRSRAPTLFALTLGTATLLLLLACVNVTTLLLSRSAARQREITVRLSLGAGRFRLLRQLLTESMMLSGLAGLLSFLIAQTAPAALWQFVAMRPAPFDLSPDSRALLYCLFVALGSGIVAGLSPAVEMLRPRLSESLKGSSTTATSGKHRSRLRSFLVASQVALSLLLLIEAGLFARAQRRFFSYDPGFEIEHSLNLTLVSVLSGFQPPLSFYQALESRIEAMSGVVGTSFASIIPWAGRSSTALREVDGQEIVPPPDTAFRLVAPEYFATLDITVTRGRLFTRDELSSQRPVIPAIISEAMARQYWPGQDPLGRRFRTQTLYEVIGVARDVQSIRYLYDDEPLFYAPLDMQKSAPPSMLIRVSGDSTPMVAAIREIVRQLDPQMGSDVGTLKSKIEQHGERLKPLLILGTIAGLLALLLALTGVYGVVSFSVSQRVREIGIRMALGAQGSDVIRLILRSGVAPVLGGLVAGIGLALAASVVVRSITFGMSARDPLTFAGVALLLLLSAFGAIWIPARRAAAMAPLASLRQD